MKHAIYISVVLQFTLTIQSKYHANAFVGSAKLWHVRKLNCTIQSAVCWLRLDKVMKIVIVDSLMPWGAGKTEMSIRFRWQSWWIIQQFACEVVGKWSAVSSGHLRWAERYPFAGLPARYLTLNFICEMTAPKFCVKTWFNIFVEAKVARFKCENKCLEFIELKLIYKNSKSDLFSRS